MKFIIDIPNWDYYVLVIDRLFELGWRINKTSFKTGILPYAILLSSSLPYITRVKTKRPRMFSYQPINLITLYSQEFINIAKENKQ